MLGALIVVNSCIMSPVRIKLCSLCYNGHSGDERNLQYFRKGTVFYGSVFL